MQNAPRERIEQSLGSGVIIDAQKGFVLTNNHVVEGADDISVTLHDGRTLAAKLVGTDPDTDVAVIKIPAENLVALPLADSGKLRMGDFVVAVGDPFGIGQSASSGMVSGLGRTGLGGRGFQNFIQTDAPINPGNSGGALVDLAGELVGINAAIIGPSGGNVGIGFAIPVNLVHQVVEQIEHGGTVQHGHLGIGIQDLTPQLAASLDLRTDQAGALISSVEPQSPAAKAGLRPGDVVVSIGGQSVADADALHNAIGLLRAGQVAQMTILRDGRPMQLRATVASR